MATLPVGLAQEGRDFRKHRIIARRNGKPSSCESCRKLKARCDHNMPVCGRCRSRCISHQCYYHPAPLTQPKPGNSENVVLFPIINEPTWTTPLLPTSYSDDLNSQMLGSGQAWMQETDFVSTTADHPISSPPPDVTVAGMLLDQVLSRLSQFDIVGELLRRWWRVSPSGPVPRCLFDKALISIESASHRLEQGPAEARRLAAEIMEASSRPWVMPPETPPRDLPKLFAEPNLRIEAVGIILATAGTAAICLPESDILFSVLSLNSEQRHRFARDILQASDACITFCDDDSPGLHDLMIWLRYASFLLTLNFCGYADHRTWSRPGQLFGDALAMEMHREPEEPSYAVPFFLNEIRTRTFVCLYAHDKVLSAILDRLPRIPRHYCSRKLPLDVNDDRLLSGGSPLEEILCGPDAEGWDGEGYRPVDLLRARYILATLREDILNVRLGNPTGDSVGFIRQLPGRIASTWDSLPSRMRFDPNNSSDLGKPHTYIVKSHLYLEYLDLHYCAQQLIHRHTGNADDTNLLQMALSLMTTAANCVRRYCRRFGASKEITSILWIYGLPSAILLANAMRQRAELGQDLPRPMTWAALYRQLSVFSSDLKTNTDRRDGDFPFYSERSSVLSAQLDQALNAQHYRHPPTCSSSASSSASVSSVGVDPITATRANSLMSLNSSASGISIADIGLLSTASVPDDFTDALTDMAMDSSAFGT